MGGGGGRSRKHPHELILYLHKRASLSKTKGFIPLRCHPLK